MPSMNRLAAALLLAFSASAALAQSSQSVPAAATEAAAFNLEADVLRAMKTFDVPGMAIAIVKDGKVIAARGFGVRKLGEPTPVDGQTLFEVASNSKAFTAVALAMLVDEGKLAWDDPVTKHLPDFQMYDAYVTHEMTVRDLLTHRSGLGLGAGDLLWWPTTTFTSDEIIEKLRYIRPATSFRNSYAYDNLLYIAAGKIVASKSGKSWGETVRERILAPVGMSATTTSLAENAGIANQSSAHSKIDDRIAAVKSMPVPNGAGADGTGVLSGLVDQIVFEGPTVRLVVDVDGTPIKVTSSGHERLDLLSKGSMRVNLRLQEVTLVRPEQGAAGT